MLPSVQLVRRSCKLHCGFDGLASSYVERETSDYLFQAEATLERGKWSVTQTSSDSPYTKSIDPPGHDHIQNTP